MNQTFYHFSSLLMCKLRFYEERSFSGSREAYATSNGREVALLDRSHERKGTKSIMEHGKIRCCISASREELQQMIDP
jgi:hypothetical protein